MDEKWRRIFLLWSETEEHKARVEEALREIRRIHSQYRKYYVAYSGGKDSICLLSLTLQVNPNVDVFHWDHGPWLVPRETENEILDIARRLGARNIIVRTSEELNSPRARYDPSPFYNFMRRELPKLAEAMGWEAVLLGLRNEESIGRRTRIRRRSWHWGAWIEAPLKNWKWLDVWAYIVSNNLPYPKVYDKYAALLGYDKVRLVTFYDQEFACFGSPIIDGVLLPEFRNPVPI